MPLDPEEVVNKRFSPTKFRQGYDEEEVDEFLDEVVAELRRLNSENEELRAKLSACEGRVAELSRSGGAARPRVPDEPAPAPVPVVPPAPVVAPAPVPVAPAAAVTSGTEGAAGMLALAQRLHDEHVEAGKSERNKIVSDAQEHAARLVREAEEKQRETLGNLEQQRQVLERKVEQLRAFEREYRSRLKAYLEGQLRELEAKASSGGAAPDAPAQSGVAGQRGTGAAGAGPQGSADVTPLPARGFGGDGQDRQGSPETPRFPFGG